MGSIYGYLKITSGSVPSKHKGCKIASNITFFIEE
ncbi:MAG: hypothetical protein ACJAWH_001238 [Maribacter sp.]|jgi:hypothetical protein